MLPTLYRSPSLLTHWVAYAERLGWMAFPAKENGWNERKSYRGDTSKLSRVPARMGFNTGFPHPEAVAARALDAYLFDQLQTRRVA